MLIAGLGFAIMGALVKQGSQYFSSAELVFYRSVFGFVVITLFVSMQKKPLATPLFTKQLLRAGTGFAALILFFYAISQLPLATAITLNYTSPLFLALLSPWWQNTEQAISHRQRLMMRGCIVLGFVGILCLLHPVWSNTMWLAGCFGLLSGLGAAFAYLHVKQLGHAGEPDWRTVFYFTGVCSLGSGLWMLHADFSPLHWAQVPLLVGLGASATLSQLAMTRAYRTGRTLTVATLAYSTVVFATLFGGWLWSEQLSALEGFGMALIIISGVISSRTTSQPNT